MIEAFFVSVFNDKPYLVHGQAVEVDTTVTVDVQFGACDPASPSSLRR